MPVSGMDHLLFCNNRILFNKALLIWIPTKKNNIYKKYMGNKTLEKSQREEKKQSEAIRCFRDGSFHISSAKVLTQVCHEEVAEDAKARGGGLGPRGTKERREAQPSLIMPGKFI